MKFKCKQLLAVFSFSISFCNCQCDNHVDGSTDIQLDSVSDVTVETNDSIYTNPKQDLVIQDNVPDQGIAIKSNSTEMPSCSSKDLPDDIEQTITKQDDSIDLNKVISSDVTTETNGGINDVKVSEDHSRKASKIRNLLISEDMPGLLDCIVKQNRIKAEIISEHKSIHKRLRYTSFASWLLVVLAVSVCHAIEPGEYGIFGKIVVPAVGGLICQGYSVKLQDKSIGKHLKDTAFLYAGWVDKEEL